MGEYAFLLTIAFALLGGAMSPGPSFLVVAQRSLSLSQAHGIATAVGTGLGAASFALLAALGITQLLEQAPTFYVGFQFVGGCYLLWLAYRILSNAKTALQDDTGAVGNKTWLTSVLKGFGVQISNPKTVFIIGSIFAAALPKEVPNYTAVWVVLIAFVVDFAWYAVVALSLSKTSSRAFYQRSKVYLDSLAACVLALLACKLFYGVL